LRATKLACGLRILISMVGV